MNRLDTCRRQMTIQELLDDPLIKGSEAAIRKTLQRLVSRGVVEAIDLPREPGQRGKPVRAFQAVMARAQGESVWMSSLSQNPVDDSKLNGTLAVPEESCPIYKGSAGAASDTVETESFSPRARDSHDAFWDDPGLTRKLEEADAAERQARLARFINQEAEEMCAAANKAIEVKEASKPVVIDVDCSNVETD